LDQAAYPRLITEREFLISYTALLHVEIARFTPSTRFANGKTRSGLTPEIEDLS